MFLRKTKRAKVGIRPSQGKTIIITRLEKIKVSVKLRHQPTSQVLYACAQPYLFRYGYT